VASTVRAVLAQRLVRAICENCKTLARIEHGE
jgi:type II secretory ATPase GspE/PulE/Tfp pilus assembly ATPase PilB-like protein